jgi:hypothetical protein
VSQQPARPSKRREGEPRQGVWHRRVGVFPRSRSTIWPFNTQVLDGGRDAPLDERGLKIWHLTLAVTMVLGLALLVAAFLSR